MRVRVLATGLATYPDVTVVCGPSERDPASPTHVVNPALLFEVLSDGTEEYDRGEKLEQYKRIPSLHAIVLFDHRKPWVEVWSRENQQWVLRTFTVGQTVELPVIDCTLDIDAVYAATRGA